jgi:hypothetical protein
MREQNHLCKKVSDGSWRITEVTNIWVHNDFYEPRQSRRPWSLGICQTNSSQRSITQRHKPTSTSIRTSDGVILFGSFNAIPKLPVLQVDSLEVELVLNVVEILDAEMTGFSLPRSGIVFSV